ncbi:hypothetical protein WDW37_09465 [Bdellovibrionota bacterium FG-1]
MADLNELLKSKKVSEFVRQGKSRPWTVDRAPTEPKSEPTNPVKTEAQPGQIPVTNPVKTEAQPGQIPVTQISQKKAKKPNPVKTEAPTRSRFEMNPVKTEAQPGHKIKDYKTLVGNDRSVMLTLFLDARQHGSIETSMFSRAALAARLGLSYEAIRSSIKRLVRFGILEKVESSKGGPGAWVLVRFSHRVFQEINLTEAQPGQIQVTNPVKTEAQPGHQPGHAVPSSSSFLETENLKTTTTSEPELFDDGRVQLSPDWSAVDATPLAEIGFTQTHLMQLAKHGKLSAAEVGSSIDFFAFDLRRNAKAKAINGSALNFFMGIVRKGIPYAPPENFETAADEARRRTREILERKERERLADEQRLKDLEYAEWRRGITEAQATALVPDPVKDIPRAREASLQNHFDEKVWPEIEVALIGVSESERHQIRAAIAQSLGEVQA